MCSCELLDMQLNLLVILNARQLVGLIEKVQAFARTFIVNDVFQMN